MADTEDRLWTYLGASGFGTYEGIARAIGEFAESRDPQFYAFIDLDRNEACGLGSYMRMVPEDGVIEMGWLFCSPAFERSRMATEALYVTLSRVFDELGYRRCQCRCDALSRRSRKAARRLGFQFEGVFRQAAVYRGRNRDIAWLSILDSEWPVLKHAFQAWLEPENFHENGHPRKPLESFR